MVFVELRLLIFVVSPWSAIPMTSCVRPSNDLGWVIGFATTRIGAHAFITFGLVSRQECRHAGFEGRQHIWVLVPFLTQVASEIFSKLLMASSRLICLRVVRSAFRT